MLGDFFDFVAFNPTALHVARTTQRKLTERGFQVLRESDVWDVKKGKYLLARKGCLIAFAIGNLDPALHGFKIIAAHSDSPALKLKPRPFKVTEGTACLGVEIYGGPLPETWKDRPLSLAGEICWESESGEVETELVDWRKPVAIVPNLAIHLKSKEAPENKVDMQKDLNPVIGAWEEESRFDFEAFVLGAIEDGEKRKQAKRLLAHELFLYDPAPPVRVGVDGSLMALSRLDNQAGCFCALRTLLIDEGESNAMIVINDHEEIGSGTPDGAKGPFLPTLLRRLAGNEETHARVMSRSLLISMDNAHATHPAFADKHDGNHPVRLNGGPVIKKSAGRLYAGDMRLAGLFVKACSDAGVPCQTTVNHNGIRGGSTLGPFLSVHLGCPTLDIGIPSLAMHSAVETGGAYDVDYAVKALTRWMSGPSG